MRCKVTLFKAGTVFEEVVIATDYQNAKKVAISRNPGAQVVSVTAIFG